MNKSDIINVLREEMGMTRADAERAVSVFIDTITNTLKDGTQVSISGLGIFEAKMRKGRTVRNPRTGVMSDIPAMRVPKFRAAKALKEAVRG